MGAPHAAARPSARAAGAPLQTPLTRPSRGLKSTVMASAGARRMRQRAREHAQRVRLSVEHILVQVQHARRREREPRVLERLGQPEALHGVVARGRVLRHVAQARVPVLHLVCQSSGIGLQAYPSVLRVIRQAPATDAYAPRVCARIQTYKQKANMCHPGPTALLADSGASALTSQA